MNNQELIELARRAEGSELLPKVMLGNQRADALLLKIADRLEQMEQENAKLRQALEVYDRERTRFRHANPEVTGEFFISGKGGEIDRNQLPEYLFICPAYGCDWTMTYKRTDNALGPQW